ncbi:unnamed protein product [Kluyveromyces dobzhanskii CBS 2104]|uniref:WGS project CCBQ000000000 data, contig 00099 n=1 Tax=Kluyveromyces dobzhanskii CBS 2104 TaxID=1427455 RepID=A0A0A8L445_9SACH|nr:unnamed protein product [Kluyveromyces dobzhanskii CBS 2104]
MKKDTDIVFTKPSLAEVDLNNQRVAVVGGTGGIGREFAKVLAQKGAKVIVVGRTFRDENVEGIEFIKADLSLVAEASRVGKFLPAENLNYVIFTTGVFAAPERKVTSEGLEEDMAISYFSRLVILKELVSRLKEHEGKRPRVFIMGYPGDNKLEGCDDLNSETSYGAISTHMKTVTANEALVYYLKNRYDFINFHGLNPGLVKTNIRDNFLGKNSWKSKAVEWLIGMTNQTAEQYAKKIVPLLAAPDLESLSGQNFDKNADAILPSEGFTDEFNEGYVNASEELLKKLGLAN